VSEDGQEIAVVDHPQGDISVSSVENGQAAVRPLLQTPEKEQRAELSPDGRWLAYATLSNIWVQSLGGGPPYQLTHLPDDDRIIQDFEWSADGKRLAFSRSRTTWGIVLFRGLETGR